MQRLNHLLDQTLHRFEMDGPAKEARAITAWPEIVGPQIAAAAEPVSVRDGVMHITTRSPVWTQELSFLKPRILAALRQRVGPNVVRDLRFRVGKISGPAAPVVAPRPTAAELAQIVLTPADETEIETASQHADPEIAALLRRVMTSERRVQAWERERGFRRCTGCGVMHAQKDALCPACRIQPDLDR